MNDAFELELFNDDEYESLLVSSSDSSSDDDVEMIMRIVEINQERNKRNTIKKYCEDVVPSYTEAEFISHFRISRQLTLELSEKFSESEIYQALIEPANSRASISPYKHMLAFLWFAGHQTASYRDVADRFDFSLSTLYDVITRIFTFLSSIAAETITWPTLEAKQRTMAFYEQNKGMPHVIGSIDGTHIKIDQPSNRATDYFNRKDYYSMNVQGICDENLKFIDVFLGYPGSVHDARVFRNCTLWGKFEDLCHGGHLLGDSAYPLLKFLLTPYRDNGHLTAAQRHFNTKLSSCRISIEHAFGVLKQRFRQLYHVKLRGHDRICHFIRACCVLHNLADSNDLVLFNGEVNPADIQPDETEYEELRAQGNNIRDEICHQLMMRR